MPHPDNLPLGRETARTTATEASPRVERSFARISWGAILAGALIGLAAQLILTLIGAAVGLATLSPATGTGPSGTTLGIGAAIWLLISSVVAMFLGGYVAGRLAGTFNGLLHGLATWATVTILTILLLTTAAGGLIGTASGLTSFAVIGSDKISRAQLPPVVQQRLDEMTTQLRQSADQAATRAQQTTPEQRDATAREIGERAAKGGAVSAAAAAVALILGALAAAFGGKTGEGYPIRAVYTEQRRTAG
jgi:predicted lipid-binding transport protein (Tim44 family)